MAYIDSNNESYLTGKIKGQERDRKVRRGKGEWPAGRAATGSRRLGRLSPMQQLPAMKMMMLFCHAFPLVLYTSSYWPGTRDQQSRRGICSGWKKGPLWWGYLASGNRNERHKQASRRFPSSLPWHERLPFIRLDRSRTHKLKTTTVLFVVLLCKSYFSGLVYQNHVVMPGWLTMKTRAEIWAE